MGEIKKTKKVLKRSIQNTGDVVEKISKDKTEKIPDAVEPKKKKKLEKNIVKREDPIENNQPEQGKGKAQKKKKMAAITSKNVSAPSEDYVPGMLSSIFGKESNPDLISTVALETIQGESIRKIEKKAEKKAESKNDSKDSKDSKDHKPTDRNAQRANRALKKSQNDTTEENARTIFIGNAPASATEKTIRALFRPYGAIDSMRMRGVVPSKEALPKRICSTQRQFHWNQQSVLFYVKFKEEAAVEKALEKNGEEVEGHKLRVSRLTKKKDYDKNTTVYIGNLPFTAQEDEVATLFEEAVGPVLFVRITRDRETGMGKGFGFVNFKDKSSVDLALQLPELIYEKRAVRITKLMKKRQVEKQTAAHKVQARKTETAQSTKIDQFKFKNTKKKTRTDEQVERRKIKKSARKAIKRKMTVKAGKSLMK